MIETDPVHDIAPRVARYLRHRLPQAGDVSVEDVVRIHGGASRETYRLTAHYRENGNSVTRRLILRRDPTSSLIETERQAEFSAYSAFFRTPVPVPEPLFLELDGAWLERPFFVMEEITGARAASPFGDAQLSNVAEPVGTQFWTILGQIHAEDPVRLQLSGFAAAPAPESCWRRELDYWEGVIDADELEPQPIARGAIRWLRRHPPPPAQAVRVVHGDYRTGNFLYDDDGRIRAILDWEMAHFGDPLEDLGWALDPLWCAGDPNRPGGMIERERALRLWEESSGLRADPHALTWWETFSHVKGLAIWISSSREFHDRRNEDPVLAFSGWFCTQAHNRILAARMAARHGAGPLL
jgi:aminoglycoside phosphotransferase (APT) family kinase protein